jgi:hypothetical protein
MAWKAEWFALAEPPALLQAFAEMRERLEGDEFVCLAIACPPLHFRVGLPQAIASFRVDSMGGRQGATRSALTHAERSHAFARR